MRKLTTPEFMEKAQAIHAYKYDYNKTVYINSNKRVCIICPEHGEFWQTPAKHLWGNGCRKCADELRARKKKQAAFSKFKGEAPNIHKNFYDYSGVNYAGMHTKVCIKCPTHGEFWQTPNQHLYSGNGCPKCSGRVPIHPDLSYIETPPGSKAVPVGTKGDYALVDDEDYDRVMQYNWYLSGGYAKNGKVGFMHRFITSPPDNMDIDHIFHNKLDNRKVSLRACTRSQNSMNSIPRKGSSVYKGVSWDKVNGAWSASITLGGSGKFLGYFKEEIEAAKAYDEAAKKYFKEFALTNFSSAVL